MKATRFGYRRLAALAAVFVVWPATLAQRLLPVVAHEQPRQRLHPQPPPTAQANTPEPATAAPPSATATASLTPSGPPIRVGSGKLIYDVESAGHSGREAGTVRRFIRYQSAGTAFPARHDLCPRSGHRQPSRSRRTTAGGMCPWRWWARDPNSTLGVDYGVELDPDHDGFGDYLIWAHPPYASTWDTEPVRVSRTRITTRAAGQPKNPMHQ